MAENVPTKLRRFAARLTRWRQEPRRVSQRRELSAALAGHARFVAQKCAMEYLRLRGGLHWDELCRQPVFLAGLERCQRESFVRMLGDVAEVCEIVLRAHGCRLDAIAQLVPAAVAAALADPAQAPPGIDAAEAGAEIGRRLERRRLEPPRSLRRVGAGSARHLLALLPFDERLQAADLDYVQNNVSFALGQVHERLRRELDCDALAGAPFSRAAAP